AMKLEVVDYLEKPITIEKIEEALERTMKRMDHRHQYAVMKAKAEQQREALIAKATMDLIMQGAEAEQAWREVMQDDAHRVVGVTTLAFPSEPPSFPDDERSMSVELKLGSEWAIVLYHYERPEDAYWE